jgi:nucleotide-binding universal stress UspA family protein
MPLFSHILVATDFSQDANRALSIAADMARALSAKLTVLHVVQMPTYAFLGGGVYVPSPDLTADIVADAKRWLAAAKDRISGVAVDTVCLEGDPALTVLRWAEEHKPDLIIVGTHGRRGVRRLLLGSVAEHIVRDAHCPAMTVRTQEPAAA